jgi:hypothetical protein
MPQKIKNSEWWQNNLGADWETIHELYLHTLGNLTLTGYNSEMSNTKFTNKREYLINSNFELNKKYFLEVQTWKEDDIKNRTNNLTELCLSKWKYFGSNNIDDNSVTGTKPEAVIIWGVRYEVKHWADVIEVTFNTIDYLANEKFTIIKANFPALFLFDDNKYKFRTLKNGIKIKTGFNADSLKRYCLRAIQLIELSEDDWKIELN